MYKSELLNKYPELNVKQLQLLMNVEFFEELQKVGYEKQSKRLSPNVVRKFIELYGKPLNEIDFK